jgi:tannase/feruloyl esterase
MSSRLSRLLWALALLAFLPAAAGAATCDSLAGLTLVNTMITAAQAVAPGAFVLPPGGREASPEFFTAFNLLPAFCRVQAIIRPSDDSHIELEVWLPTLGWNGKYLGVGNGGFGGSFNYFRLGEALNSGYASASTDTGHKGATGESQWSVGHPEKQVDFDYRAVHESAEKAKAIIHAFYGKAPAHSYFSSCSNGGRQGLMEAERYPADYDGIMAGAPAVTFGFKTFVSNRLDAFNKRGGKLVIYHGGSDGPRPTVNYYEKVVARMGLKDASKFIQLYVVPEMGHCGSGPEPNDFGQWLRPTANPQNSMLKALERWVENGVAPERIIATKSTTDGDPASGVVRTRPLCPYPQEAHWTGSGSPNEAVNYVCGALRSK